MYDPDRSGFGDSLKIKNRSFPIQGQPYTVVNADNLIKISRWAYGRSDKVNEIVDANEILQKRIKIGRIHRDLGGIPIIFKGDVINIPQLDADIVNDVEDIHPEFTDEITIRINGKVLHGFTTDSIERSINTIADSFSFSAPYNPETEESKLLDAHTFHKAELFIERELIILGTAESWDFKVDEGSTTVTIQARSKSGVLVDCPSEHGSLNFSGQTFAQIARSLIRPFGLELTLTHGDTGIFSNIKRDVTQKVFDFIAGLAKSKGFILNSSKSGQIILDKANINGEPILNIVQGDPNIIDLTAKFDGTKRFSSFKIISQSKGKPGNSSGALRDSSVKIYRPMIASMKSLESGDIQDSASWMRSRSISQSSTISVTISGWRDKNGKIILENNIVTLYAPGICIHKETRMLIEKVSLKQNGKSATLDLVMPSSYSTEVPKVEDMPWVR